MRHLIYIGIILLLVQEAHSQRKLSSNNKRAIALFTEADNFWVRRQYPQAEELLLQAIKRDGKFVEAHILLGRTYQGMKRYKEAEAAYLCALDHKQNPNDFREIYLELAEVQVRIEAYEKARENLQIFLKGRMPMRGMESRARNLLESAEFAIENLATAEAFNPRPLSDVVNQFAMQYFPVLTADQSQLIYTRRKGRKPEFDEDLVVTHRQPDGTWGPPESISDNINTRHNEGTCTIAADGRTLIFTSCFGRQGYGSCDLYISYKVGEVWSEPENLGPTVNTKAWESQPSLSADGRTLYFVSDREGGYGNSDIYVTSLDDKNQWTKPENMGSRVNTPWDEVSPFIHANGRTLYFASNGWPGFGGYDIFYLERQPEGTWGDPQNLGAPVNNGDDQLSLFITADGLQGYYVNESLGPDGDFKGRIYEFDVPEAMQVAYRSNYVRGRVYEEATKEPLAALVELYDLESEALVSQVRSDSVTGDYLMVLTEGSEYALYVSRTGYLFHSLSFNLKDYDDYDAVEIDVFLKKAASGATTVLKNIFFDFDSYALQEKSITEINKIKRFLEQNPQINIEISGHTDNTGSPQYNMELSLNRAKSVYNYLISRNIAPDRLTFKGYGLTRPKYPNDTEEGRILNRRIEFLIK